MTHSYENKSKKSRTVALLLSLLGIFGSHRFYVGRNVTATIMLLLTLTGVGIIISLAWSLADLITILRGNFHDATHGLVKNWKKKL